MAWFFLCIAVILCWAAGMLVRNQRVYTYRGKLIDRISAAVQADIARNEHKPAEWQWRWDVFESVKYDEMVNKFWRPLNSFYPDQSFVQSDPVGEFLDRRALAGRTETGA